jgi:hypothetical protein
MSNLMGENNVPTPEAAFAWDATGGDVSVGAVGGSAVLTIALAAGQQLYLSGLYCSFSASPTAGLLTITDNGTTVFSLDLGTVAGTFFLPFPKMRKSSVGTTIVITLATGGGTGVPKLNAIKQVVTA